MNMEMGNGFASILAVVDDEAVSAVCHTFLACHFGGCNQQVADYSRVFFAGFSHTSNGFAGNHQDVHWGLRGDVAECNAGLVAVENFGGDFLVADFLK